MKHDRENLVMSGGFVKMPSCDRSVVLEDGTWRKISDLRPGDTIKNYGGCAMLGTGQMVPIESVVKCGQ